MLLGSFTFALGMLNVSGIVMSMIVGILLIVAMVLPRAFARLGLRRSVPFRCVMIDDLTLVLDIGKSRAKLLMIDALGEVVEEHARENRSVASELGYAALDVRGLTHWVTRTLAGSATSTRCVDAMASPHGAAIVALGDGDDSPGIRSTTSSKEATRCTTPIERRATRSLRRWRPICPPA